MELSKVENFCVKLRDSGQIERASKFDNPIVPIGFKCNKRVRYRIIKKSNSGVELLFSDFSFSEYDENICYMFYKNSFLKKSMIESIINMFSIGYVYIQIHAPIVQKEKMLDGIDFEPVFAQFCEKDVIITGGHTGLRLKKKRLCFNKFVSSDDLIIDHELLGKVGGGEKEGERENDGDNIRTSITKKSLD